MGATLKRDIAKGLSYCLVSVMQDLKSILQQGKSLKGLMVTRPSFFGGGTMKLSGISTFTFIVSLTHRMDNI